MVQRDKKLIEEFKELVKRDLDNFMQKNQNLIDALAKC